MLFKINTSAFLTMQRLCLPLCLNRAVCVTTIRFSLIFSVFGTFLYFAVLSSQAVHHKNNSFKTLTKSENSSNCDNKIRGVNLGGWLVLEPWITPSIFEEVNVGRFSGAILDEYTYYQHVPHEKANPRLEK